MSKYRIISRINFAGHVRYYPQYDFLFLWFDFGRLGGSKPDFATLRAACDL